VIRLLSKVAVLAVLSGSALVGSVATAAAMAPSQGGPTANLAVSNQVTDNQTVTSGSGSFSHWVDCPAGGAPLTGTGQAYNITDSGFDNAEYSVSSSQKIDADTWRVSYSLHPNETYHVVSFVTCLNVS
jgi:hypothetical protein